MSEINDEGLLPPNVHHARPQQPERSDEEADRERAAADVRDAESEERSYPGDARPSRGEVSRPPRQGRSDDPYAKDGEDPYAEPAKGTGTPKTADAGDAGRVDGHTDTEGEGSDDAGTGDGSEDGNDAGAAGSTRPVGTGMAGVTEPPD